MKMFNKYVVRTGLTALLVLLTIIAITQIAGKETVVKEKEEQELVKDDEQPTHDNPWAEMEKLMAAYDSKEGITYTGLIKLIDANEEKDKVLEETPFEFTLLDNEYHYKLSNVEMVNKKNFVLLVEHTTKSIALTPKSATSTPEVLFNREAFKKLLLERKAQAKVSATKSEKIITIDSIQDPQIQGYRIYYSPETYRIHKIEIGMLRFSPLQVGDADSDGEAETLEESESTGTAAPDESAPEEEEGLDTYVYFLEIIYTDARTLTLSKEEFHPEKKFIQTVNHTIQLTPAYQEYTLVNAEN